ncbi:MAG: hypothetical protein RIR97_806 [Pseudomonadota bacterium]|jgi:antitoxin (DNA-binding transcriptional repressor) of toxin-antitoxin stability system
MLVVQLSDAEKQFSNIMDKVREGETILLNEGDSTFARISPEIKRTAEEITQALNAFKEARKSFAGIKLLDLIDARHEDHRY